MQGKTLLIKPERLYKPSEIARSSRLNPRGQGLVDICYMTLWRKINNNEFPLQEDKEMKGGYRRVYIRGSILIKYNKFGSKIFIK